MADNELMTKTDEKPLLTAAASDSSENIKDMIYIDENHSRKKDSKGDDVMLMQFILCLLIVLSVFLLKFINGEFQQELLSMYSDKINAPAEPFIADILKAAEAFFKK